MDAIQEITRKFDELELHYRVTPGQKSDVVRLGLTTESGAKIDFAIFPNGGGSDISVRVYSLVKVTEPKMGAMLRACNQLNSQFRFVKFTIDSDLDLNVEYDIAMHNGEIGETVLEMIIRFRQIINEGYPVLMRAMYA